MSDRVIRGRGTGWKSGAVHHRVRYGNDIVERARTLRDAGKSYTAIASEIGVSWNTVRDWVSMRTRVHA